MIDLVIQRTPQTLKVVGLSYVLAMLIAIPIGVISATHQYSLFDQVGTVMSVIGFSVPTFFTGLLAIIIFSVNLRWFPSSYNTTLKVTDWSSFVAQVKQMFLPVMVLTFFQIATLEPVYAFFRARQPETGLCADGAVQGLSRACGCVDGMCCATA